MKDILSRCQKYQLYCTHIARAHYMVCENAAKWNNRLGVPVTVITAIIGTSIFGTINNDPAIGWKIVAGLMSLSAAILSALQTTFKFSELAEKHKIAGNRFSGLRRQIEFFILKYSDEDKKNCDIAFENRDTALKDLEKIIKNYSALAEESPVIPTKIAYKAKAFIAEWRYEINELETKMLKTSSDSSRYT